MTSYDVDETVIPPCEILTKISPLYMASDETCDPHRPPMFERLILESPVWLSNIFLDKRQDYTVKRQDYTVSLTNSKSLYGGSSCINFAFVISFVMSPLA